MAFSSGQACMQHAAAPRIITEVVLTCDAVLSAGCSADRQTSSDQKTDAQMCLNRLLWGGLKVSVLLHKKKSASNVPESQHLRSLLPPQVQVCDSWQPSTAYARAPSPANTTGTPVEQDTAQPPYTLLVISDRDVQWASQLPEGHFLVWMVDTTSAGITTEHGGAGSQLQPSTDEMCASAGAAPWPGKLLPSLWHLPQQLALQQQSAAPRTKLVAYVMSAKREKELSILTPVAAQGQPAYTGGLLCLVPHCDLVFMPLDLTQPLEEQAPFQVLLHKASDYLQQAPYQPPAYADAIQQLQLWLQARPHIKVVDPLDCTAKVIDRVALSKVIGSVTASTTMVVPGDGQLHRSTTVTVASPKYCVIDAHDEDQMLCRVQAAGLQAPYMVKPSVACGLPASHTLCLVLAGCQLAAAVQAAGLTTPLVIQEFRNHGGLVAKVYVAGQQVFHALRTSIPDLPVDIHHQWSESRACTEHPEQHHDHVPGGSMQSDGPASHTLQQLCQHGYLVFDSLKSLPTQWFTSACPSAAECPLEGASLQHLLPTLLQKAAAKLQQALGLSLFGFDVVAVQPAPDQVQLQVIDVNYLPNYRVPGAATHIWELVAGTAGTT